MEAKDLFITPIFLLIVFSMAYFLRPLFTDNYSKKYFLPALALKVFGAIFLGIIYQFYYQGGDTYTYFTHGSSHIWNAFLDSPALGFKLIFAGKEYMPETFIYARKIWTFGDIPSYFVVRVAGLFGLITFNTYSATAVLFAVLSFSGIWALFQVFYKYYPQLHFEMAIACLFIPSVFFWGSGILKDTLTLGAVGWITWSVYRIFICKKNILPNAVLFLVAFYIIYVVKIYILLCLLPALLLWVSMQYLKSINNAIIRWSFAPLMLFMVAAGGYYAIQKIGEENSRYNLDQLSMTAEATARWIHFVSERDGGSGYSLGDYDYSAAGIIKKAPKAIWVSLYRPYLWEVRNPVMFMSAIESLAFLLFTLYVLIIGGWKKVIPLVNKPMGAFCLVFAISFAFAVGLTTYNFGSLVRYKIPMLPFFAAFLFLLHYNVKRSKKVSRQAITEY